MRMQWLIGQFLGRKRQRCRIVGRKSVQVKATELATSFGNDAPSFTRIMGKKGTLLNAGGEGSPRWQFVKEIGNHEDDFDVDKKRTTKDILLPGDKTLPPAGMGDEDLSHLTNWFDCLRWTRSSQPT